MKKLLLILLVGLVLISVVSAQPPFQQTTVLSEGIQIESPVFELIKANQSFTFHLHAHNISSGLLLINNTVDFCSIHVFNEIGEHIVNQNMTFSGEHTGWELTVLEGNFTRIGLYAALLNCEVSGEIGGFFEYSFRVTNSGLEFSDVATKSMIIAIVFLILVGGLFFVGFIKEDKLQVKWSLFIIGFIFLLAGLNTISVMVYDNITSTALIGFFDSLTSIMFIALWLAVGLLAVMWFLTLLQAILFGKKMKEASRFGGIME